MLKAVKGLESSPQIRQLARRLGFRFASELSKARLRALWASKFITLIRGDLDPDNSSVLTTSLQDQLRSCKLEGSHFDGFEQSEQESL
jgi:hypothetical protein